MVWDSELKAIASSLTKSDADRLWVIRQLITYFHRYKIITKNSPLKFFEKIV
ncbi:hypothetical protein [Nostoc sp. PA-18-2419]|uniref:hypothetical protein n=1 Tax=Nostoc sp. PA-18-2419 TaxID=2575443 RepID=UPI0016727060|nr:hypothetical protein [Nostoc sp. PA-18-2419]